MEYTTQVQILDEVIYTSRCINTIEKGMNPSALMQAISE